MAQPIVMPKLGDFMIEGIVAKWARSDGEAVRQGEVITEIESEKLNYDLEAAGNGILHIVASEGSTVPVDGIMGYLLAGGEAPPEIAAPAPAAAVPAAAPPAPRSTTPPTPRAAGTPVPSTPGARRLAAKLGVDLSEVTPSGPRGRVTEADVRTRAEERGAPSGPAPASGPDQPSRTEPLAGIRKSIADHMRGSLARTAQLSFFLELDVTDAQLARKEASAGGGVTIAMAHVLTKACAESLKRNPELNSLLSDGSIQYFDEVNFGVAVALKEGLIVPVLRQAGAKSISEIALETNALADKARDGKLHLDDMAGGTFTISVLGAVDGFTPILNAGQSAILGVGRSVEKPVVKDGDIVVREMMTVSLTVDHQVIDGAVAAGFLRRLKQLVERPAGLFK
jgi:pyruvate dehydrogenase E2 component (dihydrolipoamide acetyltransferase)